MTRRHTFGSLLLAGLSSFALLLLGATSAVAAAPSNDDIENATPILSLPFGDRVDVREATTGAAEEEVRQRCDLPGVNTGIWYSISLPFEVQIEARVYGPSETSPSTVWAALVTGDPDDLSTLTCLPLEQTTLLPGAGTYYLLAYNLFERGQTTEIVVTNSTCKGGGDLDNDTCDDVAVGAPAATVGGIAGAGLVEVRYGNSYRSWDKRKQILTQGSVAGESPEAADGFGGVLLMERVDDDEFGDLVVGVPREDVAGRVNAGVVQVIFGSAEGLGGGRGSLVLRQGSVPGTGAPEAGDAFGSSLAITSDGRLAIGAPSEDVGTVGDAGAVVLFDLHGDGELPLSGQLLVQGGAVPGRSEPGDHFGAALTRATQSFLAVGVPGEDVATVRDAGAVVVFSAADTALAVTQNSVGMPGRAEAGDAFGAALGSAPDESLIGMARLAIGVPGEDIGRIRDAGAISFLKAVEPRYVFRPDALIISQDTPGIVGAAEAGDRFGSVLGRLAKGEQEALLVGIPAEDVGLKADAGAIVEIRIREVASSLGTTQASASVPGIPEAGDRFGAALGRTPPPASAEEDGTEGVLVGVPGEDLATGFDAGVVQALTRSDFVGPLGAGLSYGAAIAP